MVVKKIQDLIMLSGKLNDTANPKCLIEREPRTLIYIFKGIKNIIFTSYNRETLIKYQDNTKAASMMSNTLVHEMVHDPNSLLDYMVPFLFSNEIARKPTPIFNWFICLLDLKKVDEFEKTDPEPGQNLWMNEFCDMFLIYNIEDPMCASHKEEDHVVFENCRTRDCPLFCRSSNWKTCTLNHGKDGE